MRLLLVIFQYLFASQRILNKLFVLYYNSSKKAVKGLLASA